MKRLQKIFPSCVSAILLLGMMPAVANAQMGKVKTVWVILMENHNWTGNNAGAAFGAPDIKGNPLAPYINGELLQTSAHAEQYFNPPATIPASRIICGWKRGPTSASSPTHNLANHNSEHNQALSNSFENAGISWRAYAEPDFGSPVFDVCPLDFTYLDVEHLAFVYFNDVNDGLNPPRPNVFRTSGLTTNSRRISPTTRRPGITSLRRTSATTGTRTFRRVTATEPCG